MICFQCRQTLDTVTLLSLSPESLRAAWLSSRMLQRSSVGSWSAREIGIVLSAGLINILNFHQN